MKKVIISICAVVAAAAAAQAQGVARDVNYFGQEYLAQQAAVKAQARKQEARQMQALEKAVRKAAEKKRHQQMLVAEAAKPIPAENKTAAAKKPAKDTTAKTAAKQSAKETQPTAKKAKKRSFGQKILAVIGGKYEWETDEEYHQRVMNMGYAANQPFK